MLKDSIAFLKGQGLRPRHRRDCRYRASDSEIVDLVDFPMYVMTSDSRRCESDEKIDMIDFADLVVLNKFDRRGAQDALRDVRKQWKRNHVKFELRDEDVPVYPTIASQFNDPGVTWMFSNLCRLLRQKLNLPAENDTMSTRASGSRARPCSSPATGCAICRRSRNRAGVSTRMRSARIERQPRAVDVGSAQ